MRRLALFLTIAFTALPAAATAAEAGHYDGTIYVESNNYRKDKGSVFAFRYAEGKINPKPREYKTGGHGSHDLSNSGVLDIDGSIVTSSDNKFLFAVNTGTDTIAVFRIASNGALQAGRRLAVPVAGQGARERRLLERPPVRRQQGARRAARPEEGRPQLRRVRRLRRGQAEPRSATPSRPPPARRRPRRS